MRIEQLGYFVEICRTYSLNEAAKRLYISQPALTQYIKGLEAELGVQLFVRDRKGIYPTKVGLSFLHHAQRILKEYDEMIADINQSIEFDKALSIVAYPIISNLYMLNILNQLETAFPQLTVHFHEIFPKELKNYLQNSPESIAIIVENHSDETFGNFLAEDSLETVKIAKDEVKAFVSCHSPYAKLDCLKQEHYPGINFISLRNYENVSPLASQRTTNTCSQNAMLNQHLILNQSAVHFLPQKLGRGMFDHPDIVSVPIEPPNSVTYYIVCRKETLSGQFQPAVVFLVDVLRQLLG